MTAFEASAADGIVTVTASFWDSLSVSMPNARFCDSDVDEMRVLREHRGPIGDQFVDSLC